MRVDGGVTRSDLLLQFQSDILQIEIDRPISSEMTALGAALLAGLGANLIPSLESIRNLYQVEKTFSPHDVPKYEELKNRYHKAIQLIKELEKNHDES